MIVVNIRKMESDPEHLTRKLHAGRQLLAANEIETFGSQVEDGHGSRAVNVPMVCLAWPETLCQVKPLVYVQLLGVWGRTRKTDLVDPMCHVLPMETDAQYSGSLHVARVATGVERKRTVC